MELDISWKLYSLVILLCVVHLVAKALGRVYRDTVKTDYLSDFEKEK